MRIATTILAALLATVLTCISGARAEPADDLALITQHNTQAHLLALWWLGQPDAAASLSADQARALYRALGNDEDWRVRWLAAEALAGAIAGQAPADSDDYRQVRFRTRDLELALFDEQVYVREAAARGLAATEPSKNYRVPREIDDALGDCSPAASKFMIEHAGRIIVANPAMVEHLLWEYRHADGRQFALAESYLEKQSYRGHPDAEQGRELLEQYIRELRIKRSHIRLAFRRAGAEAMPALLELWDQEPRLQEDILQVWETMGESAADAGPQLAQVLADRECAYWWRAEDAAKQIKPPNREELALLMLPRVCCAEPDWDVMETLRELGPLSDAVAQPIIEQIQSGVDKEMLQLVNTLGIIGPQSDLVFKFLAGLAQDEGSQEEERQAAIFALSNMARAGNAEAARLVLEIAGRDSASPAERLNAIRLDDELINHPEVVAVLADAAGAVEVALRQPELLALPELNVRVRPDVIAEITDPNTEAWLVNWLATLLPLLDPPPVAEIEEALWARYGDVISSGRSSTAYIQALASLYPGRARELYLKICDSEEKGDSYIASDLLAGLGAECEPLLPVLVVQLIGTQAAEELQPFFNHDADQDHSKGVSANYEQDFDLSRRYRLVQAIQACGADAARYMPQLWWALKRAYQERTFAAIPVSALQRPELDLEYAISRSHRPYDSLINALIETITALGPAAGGFGQGVVHGSLNDGLVEYISSVSYRNPEYDRRLRNAAIAILGETGTGSRSGAGLLVEQLQGEPRWTGWYSHDRDELDEQRMLYAAEALGKIGAASDEVVMALLDAALDENTEVQAAAVAALRQLAGWEYPGVE